MKTLVYFSLLVVLLFQTTASSAQSTQSVVKREKKTTETQPLNNTSYTLADIKSDMRDDGMLIFAGSITIGAGAGLGYLSGALFKLVWHSRNSTDITDYCSPGGCWRTPPVYPVKKEKEITYGVGVPIVCAGIALIAVGSVRLAHDIKLKRQMKMKSGLLEDGTIGIAMNF